MAKENPQLVTFAVPEFDAPAADKFLETFRSNVFIDITRWSDEKEIIKDKEKMILPIMRYRILVWGGKEDAGLLGDLLIGQDWFPSGDDWGVRWGTPNEEWEQEERKEDENETL